MEYTPKENILRTKTFNLAVRIVNLYKYLVSENKEFVMSKQILRSGTNPAAMIRESEYAESAADFIHKLQIAQKETNETLFWLELLYKTQYIDQSAFESLKTDTEEILKILTSSIKTKKKNRKKD